MRWLRHSDLAAYAALVAPCLACEPLLTNVIATLINARLDGSVTLEPDALWLSAHEDLTAPPIAIAVNTPPRGVLLGPMSDEAATNLAIDLARTHPELPDVTGPAGATTAFQATFTARTGRAARVALGTRLFRLDATNLVMPRGVVGAPRPATAGDRDVLVEWTDAFWREATPHQPRRDPAEAIDARLGESGLLWLWQDGEPVAMCWLAPSHEGVVRLSGVYTPPTRRGHGYASGVVAAASAYALDHGSATVVLYTDLANPISNKIYQRLGYQPVADGVDWLFTR